MSLNYVTLTLDLVDGQGNPVTEGWASLAPSATLTDTADGLNVTQAPVLARFRSGIATQVRLLATDNGALAPAGWGWSITFTGVPGAPAGFSFFLPFASGASQNLSAQTPVASVTTMAAYLPLDYPVGAAAGYVWTSDANGNGSWQPSGGLTNPMSAVGDMIDGGAAGAATRLPGNTAAGRKFLRSTGTGTTATAPAWDILQIGDIPQAVNGVRVVAAATGTYVTDMANIGAAIAAAGTNGTLYFPAGTYAADSLAPLNGQTWYGPATIQRPSGGTNSVITATGLTGFTMRGLTIDGNAANSTATSSGAVYLINSAWCVLSGITVQNTPAANAGIILRGAVRCIVDACQLTSVGYGILLGLNHGDNYSCYGNIIRGCTIDTTVADAIFLTENLGSTGSVSVIGSVIGTVVSGCVVRNFGDCGIEVGSGTVYTEVSGCTFDGIGNANGNNGILFRDSAHSSVTGCTVSNLTKSGSTGVYMVNLNGSNSHISVNAVDVTGCGYGYIVQGGTSGSNIGTAALDIGFNGGVISGAAINGINLVNVSGFSITGTHVYAPSQQGIAVGKFSTAGSGCTDGTITGCRVFNSGQGAASQSGIILFQNTADVTITGCRIGDNQGGGATQAYGVRVFDAAVTNVNVAGNDLAGNVTAAFNNASSVANGVLYAPKVLIAQASPAAFHPADPASTVSLSLVMMGLGGTCAYTPVGSGKVLVNVSVMNISATAAANVTQAAYYGTGVAPVNGAAQTGTLFGGNAAIQIKVNSTGGAQAAAYTDVLSLTPGTAYWFDLGLSTTNAADAAIVKNIAMAFAELP